VRCTLPALMRASCSCHASSDPYHARNTPLLSSSSGVQAQARRRSAVRHFVAMLHQSQLACARTALDRSLQSAQHHMTVTPCWHARAGEVDCERREMACIHTRASELAPCVLVRHPEYYDNTGKPSPQAQARGAFARLNPHGFWAMPKRAVQKQGTPHQYDLTLAEMRQYENSRMVLVLAPQNAQQGRARYPADVDLGLLVTSGAHHRLCVVQTWCRPVRLAL
jgi:hypothetical protein